MDPVVPLSSPVTKTYSKTGVSPAAKQRENDAFDRMVVGEDVSNSLKIDENDERENDAFDRMVVGGDATNSPKIDESYFLPSQDQNLINFSSPSSSDNTPKKEMSTPSTRRSTRIKTPLIKRQ